MLEAIARPRVAQVAYGALALLSGVYAFLGEGITTRNGMIPAPLIMPIAVAFFIVRIVGITLATTRESGETAAFGYVATSWVLLAGALFVVGLLPDLPGSVGLAAFVALDYLLYRRGRRAANEGEGRVAGRLRRFAERRGWLLLAGGAAALVAFHLLIMTWVPFAFLLDWALVALAFSIYLRFLAAGKPASEGALRPPAAHRIHTRVERPVPDPLASSLDSACRSFLDEGDAAGLLSAAREAGAFAGLADAGTEALERRMLEALARAGTSRAADLDAAVAALETTIHPGGTPS